MGGPVRSFIIIYLSIGESEKLDQGCLCIISPRRDLVILNKFPHRFVLQALPVVVPTSSLAVQFLIEDFHFVAVVASFYSCSYFSFSFPRLEPFLTEISGNLGDVKNVDNTHHPRCIS